ncbi:tRNA adenosine deaminase-associated protein [Prauserella halophila]|uniref:tRNA adenosine deaminase-associated protein n=1 Tax=Prauserella halophila TaxID=185641 RepID=A0ABN1WCM5_9PSEU|nr:tRNA adenosine deaminase-associated protein [Prauserella halophila]MCP2237062.1 putative tRNA adenosine deaminase-associated protein [Prauserella halophila]
MPVEESITGFAVAVVREDGRWQCSALDQAALAELDAAITELRKLRSTGAVFGLLAVDDEFFVVVRPTPSGAQLMVSDAAAALDYDIAADVLDLLRAEPPDEDDDTIWPEGDLEVLADLGMPAPELEVIAGEADLYPDEQLGMIAQRCGFGDEFNKALDEL